jgi:hypothetical protein
MSRIDGKQWEHLSARRRRGRGLLKMRHEEVPPEDARAPRVFQHIAKHKRARVVVKPAAEQGASGLEQHDGVARRPFVLKPHDTEPHTFRGLAAHVVERQLAESWHFFVFFWASGFFSGQEKRGMPSDERAASCLDTVTGFHGVHSLKFIE